MITAAHSGLNGVDDTHPELLVVGVYPYGMRGAETTLVHYSKRAFLLSIFKYYSCSVKTIIFGKKEIAYSHFIIVGFYCVGESKFTSPICYIDGYFIQTHTILLSLDSGRA